jgi:hypothetical protein
MNMMKTAVKLALALLITIPVNSVFAGGHMKGWEASGTQMPVSSETIAGKTGSITHIKSKDMWDYSKAPDNMPRVVGATCHNSVVTDPSGVLLGGVGVCESVDPNGDVSLYSSTFGKDGVYNAVLTQGTGVYAEYVGIKFTGSFIGQLPEGGGIYHLTPK